MISSSFMPSDTAVGGLACHVSGTGTPLLMLHGIISDSSFFTECAELLSHFYTVITYDRRSYGQSRSRDYTDYSVHTQAEDAARILSALTDEPAFILGNSAGGLIGLELALSHPNLVRGLLMIEPSLGYDPADREKLLAWNRTLNGYAETGQYKQVLPEFARTIGGSTREATSTMADLRRTFQNLNAFMEGELNEVQHYLPNADRLAALKTPAALAITERGRESIFATSTVSAAQYTGLPLFHLPGYHNVVQDFPQDAAVTIHGIFESMQKGLFPPRTYTKKENMPCEKKS